MDMLSQQDQLDLAACYIKQMTERVEKLKRVKEQAITTTRTSRSTGMASKMIGLRLPVVELRDFGEEGAEVVSASYSTVGDKVFHTIHAQVRILRVGVETSRVWERLQELIS
ncbi:hypothetical protein OIU84_008331 [Salix udensis]|uniref:Uncharacterized protein n=1 Tax=Salix udensis TaxID=889485 RepID=A0AAD6P0F3_9ROSI|nr:hypothetical protein OIU84_008331 [Salix udensis]